MPGEGLLRRRAQPAAQRLPRHGGSRRLVAGAALAHRGQQAPGVGDWWSFPSKASLLEGIVLPDEHKHLRLHAHAARLAWHLVERPWAKATIACRCCVGAESWPFSTSSAAPATIFGSAAMS